MKIEQEEFSTRLYGEVLALLPGLSSSPPPTLDQFKRMMGLDSTHLLIARQGDRAVGMLTLVTFAIPTGQRALIEDVVVDPEARGHGIGAELTKEAIRLAEAKGIRTIDLTSRPSREAANRLYQRLGFVLRETNVYRYTCR